MRRELSKALFDEAVSRFSPRLLEVRRWTVLAREFPTFDVVFEGDGRQPFRVRFAFDEWDARPPSAEMLSRGGGALAKIPEGPGKQFHVGFHRGKPFICMAGIREYHEHPQHRSDSWDDYRGTSDFDLGGIVTKVWFAWSKATP